MLPTSDRLESLFADATILPPEKRGEFLNEACKDDPSLFERLEGLLKAHDASNRPIDQPAIDQVLEVTQVADQRAEGSVIAGRYKLLKQIDEGGMGTVWVAE